MSIVVQFTLRLPRSAVSAALAIAVMHPLGVASAQQGTSTIKRPPAAAPAAKGSPSPSGNAAPAAAAGAPRPTGGAVVPAKPASTGTEPGAGKAQVKDGAPLERPIPPQLRIEPLTEDLHRVLKNWETHSARIKTLHGKHQRIVYNDVFEVEKHSEGQFYYECPDHGRIDVKGLEPPKGAQGQKLGKKGIPFRVEADIPERWVCDGRKVISINDDEKSFQEIAIPETMRGANIINSPLPFLFGLKVEEAQRRFLMKLVKEDAKFVSLQAIPRMGQDAASYQKADIILDKSTYLPTAVRLVDPAGTVTTVYKFSGMNLNQQGMAERLKSWLGKDPFTPDVRGYRMIQPDQADDEMDAEFAGPPKTNPASRPEKATKPAIPGNNRPIQEAVEPSKVPKRF